MGAIDIVVIGASAGGLQALLDILGALPEDLSVPILAVVHTPPSRESNLPQVLSAVGPLRSSFVTRDQVLEPGHVYVAPPDYHVLITRIGATLNHGPKENGFRPAIDPLFRSAARIHGPRAMGVILSGALDDGAYGLKLVKDAGGIAVVQDPEQALVQSMPLSALQYVAVDHVLRTAGIATLITESTRPKAEERNTMPREKEKESEPVGQEEITIEQMKQEFGDASALTCPDCGGALWEIIDGQLVRYRCHVGHQYSQEGLDSGQRDVVEEALWTAVRVLEEHADLRTRMSRRADLAGLNTVSTGFLDSAQAAHVQAQAIRDVLIANGMPPLTGREAPALRAAAPLRATSPLQAAASLNHKRQPAPRRKSAKRRR
jgi:two-component system, chemotaxis family, protein-glutamate methylesterase/glutaminase